MRQLTQDTRASPTLSALHSTKQLYWEGDFLKLNLLKLIHMTRTNCENCFWGDKCSEAGGCEHYDPLNENYEDKLLLTREQYEYEYQTYLAVWTGNDKWGDLYDQQ